MDVFDYVLCLRLARSGEVPRREGSVPVRKASVPGERRRRRRGVCNCVVTCIAVCGGNPIS